MTNETFSRQSAFPEGPAAAARLLEPALAHVAGEGAEPVSVTIDYAAPGVAGASIQVEAAVDRATRTLVFAYGRLIDQAGQVLATGAAVFRRVKAG